MNVQEQIKKYIAGQLEPKRGDMQALHRIILQIMPACKLWFLDGENSENKTLQIQHYGIYPFVGRETFKEYMQANNNCK